MGLVSLLALWFDLEIFVLLLPQWRPLLLPQCHARSLNTPGITVTFQSIAAGFAAVDVAELKQPGDTTNHV
jgi:hypothetical protein